MKGSIFRKEQAAVGDWDRTVAELESAAAWIASNMQGCSSLSIFLKIVITAS